MSVKKVLNNCKLIDGVSEQVKDNYFIKIESGYIIEVGQGQPHDTRGYEVADCEGNYVMPGLIDCHVHLVWDLP